MGLRAFNVLSLCSGVGGLDLGLALAVPEARTVCWVEREAPAIACLVAGIAEGALDDGPIWTDATTFDGKPWRGVVDCVSGGYPCQGESLAGKRKGKSDERWLWDSFERIIGEIGPEWCFFENVSGHLSMGFETVVDDLQGMGYEVAAGLFTAEEVGASHKRERLFIVANAKRSLRWADLHSRLHERDREDDRWRETQRASERIRWDVVGEERPLADSVGQRLQGRPMLGGDSGSEFPPPERVRGLDVVDAACDGRGEERAEHEFRCGGATPAFASRSIPLFPPLPGDLYSWLRVLESDPSLEPAVRRVAHGVAHRIHRLRACGNGVVPLEAAYAFRTLLAALSPEHRTVPEPEAGPVAKERPRFKQRLLFSFLKS